MVQSIMKKFMVQMNPDLTLHGNVQKAPTKSGNVQKAPTKFLVEAEKVELREDYAVFLTGGVVSGLCRSPVSVLVQPKSAPVPIP